MRLGGLSPQTGSLLKDPSHTLHLRPWQTPADPPTHPNQKGLPEGEMKFSEVAQSWRLISGTNSSGTQTSGLVPRSNGLPQTPL